MYQWAFSQQQSPFRTSVCSHSPPGYPPPHHLTSLTKQPESGLPGSSLACSPGWTSPCTMGGSSVVIIHQKNERLLYHKQVLLIWKSWTESLVEFHEHLPSVWEKWWHAEEDVLSFRSLLLRLQDSPWHGISFGCSGVGLLRLSMKYIGRD